MKLTFKTVFGERTFEVPVKIAEELIERAEKAQSEPKACVAADEPPYGAPARETYYEVREDELRKEDEPPRGYKGFLYVKCEKCGKTKGFCASRPMFYHRCECRHNTPLVNLARMTAKCKCGHVFRYMTNMVDPQFTMNCMSCGSPIDLELDGHGTAYVTMEN